MPAPYEFRPPWPPRAALIGPLRPPHAALIPIYWNLAWPVRLPLPIIPGINDRDVSLRWIRGKYAYAEQPPTKQLSAQERAKLTALRKSATVAN